MFKAIKSLRAEGLFGRSGNDIQEDEEIDERTPLNDMSRSHVSCLIVNLVVLETY